MLGYRLFNNHEHEGPYCVYTLHTAGEVRDSLQGYLLRKPYANAEALAVLGAAPADDARITARLFVEQGEVQGAIIVTDRLHLPPMQPEALGHVLNFIDERYALQGGTLRGFVDMHSAEAPAVVQAWQADSERVAESRQVHDYHLYSDILEPPALPDTSHLTVRVATPADKLALLERALPLDRQQRKELRGLDAAAHTALLTRLGFATPYVVEGSTVLQDAVYDVAPISQSGALLTNLRLSVAPWRKPLDYGRAKFRHWWNERSRPEAAAEDASHAALPPAIRQVVQPELTQHFAALAGHFRKEGRWFMFRSGREEPETLPVAAVARELGCHDAGSREIIRLSGREVEPGPAMGGLRILRLG